MIGEYLIEALAQIPTEVEFASEFRHRNTPMTRDTLVFAISQSGETADTLGALRESRRKGYRTLGICNNVASTIARESDGGVYMHAGPEIGVAATKSFTSQVTILTLLALLLGRIRHLSTSEGIQIIHELEAIPEKIRAILKLNDHIKSIAHKYSGAQAMMFLGRQFNYPVALEGALKMKEISYHPRERPPERGAEARRHRADHARGAERLHRARRFRVRQKHQQHRGGQGAQRPRHRHRHRGLHPARKGRRRRDLHPACPDFLSPILTVIPLQLLAYHLAVKLGCDVDKPRNLAKSVTVE